MTYTPWQNETRTLRGEQGGEGRKKGDETEENRGEEEEERGEVCVRVCAERRGSEAARRVGGVIALGPGQEGCK